MFGIGERLARAARVPAAAAFVYAGLALVDVLHADRVLGNAVYAVRLQAQAAPARLPVPVQGLAATRVRDSWHAARDGGQRRHEGIDLFAPRGTPVLSATEGIVWRRGLDARGGRVVWVLGPAGHLHYYAHLDAYGAPRPGDRVAARDVLGTVGNTGNARGAPPHLHYGIYGGGGAINPYPLLATPRA